MGSGNILSLVKAAAPYQILHRNKRECGNDTDLNDPYHNTGAKSLKSNGEDIIGTYPIL